MQEKTKKAAWWFVTAVASVFMGVWSLTAQPQWWPTALALATAIVSVVLGKPWSPPQEPQ